LGLGSTFLYLKRLYPGSDSKGGERTITLKVGGVQKMGAVYFFYLSGSQKAVRSWSLAVI